MSGTGTIASPNSPTSTVSNLGIGTNVFRWTINNGPAGAPTTDQGEQLTVFSNAQLAANAGPDQQLCAPDIGHAGRQRGTEPASGQWTLVAGSGAIVNAAFEHLRSPVLASG